MPLEWKEHIQMKQNKEQTAEEYLKDKADVDDYSVIIYYQEDVLKALSLKEQEVKKGFNELRDVDDEVIKELK